MARGIRVIPIGVTGEHEFKDDGIAGSPNNCTCVGLAYSTDTGHYMVLPIPHQHGIAYADINDQSFSRAMKPIPF